MLEVRNLKKSYKEVDAVCGVSFDVKCGEVFGLLGPNGAGKTTTLEMIEGLRKADSGTMRVAGYLQPDDKERIKQVIGVQLQACNLPDLLSVREMVKLYLSFYDETMSLNEVLELVGLTSKSTARVTNLSGGQKQRLMLGLALLNKPRLVFLDEPTTGLDPQARRALWEIISKLKDEGKTVVLTTHYMEEAAQLCDRVAIMDGGKIIACDTPNGLVRSLDFASTITITATSGLDITGLPGVTDAIADRTKFTIHTTAPESTLAAVVEAAQISGSRLLTVEIQQATLEDVFIKLTGKSLREVN